MLCAALLAPMLASAQDEEQVTPASDTATARTWYDSFTEATNVARQTKRQMLLVYQTEWCRWCQTMNDSTWADTDILNMANSLIFTRIDGDLDTATVSKYHVTRFPTTILTSDQGIEVDRFVGYFGPRDLQEEITRALEGDGTLWELERRLSETKNDPKIMLAVARKYLERGEPLRAIEFLERAGMADQSGDAGVADDVLFAKAQIKRDERNWYKAIEDLKQLVKKYPESEWREDAELYIPWLYAQAGDDKEALKRYNEFLGNYGSSTETQWVKRQLAKLEPAMEKVPAQAPPEPEGQ